MSNALQLRQHSQLNPGSYDFNNYGNEIKKIPPPKTEKGFYQNLKYSFPENLITKQLIRNKTILIHENHFLGRCVVLCIQLIVVNTGCADIASFQSDLIVASCIVAADYSNHLTCNVKDR